MYDNIKLVMLKTGENLVGNTTNDEDGGVVIVDPLMLIPVNQQQFGFAQYLQFTTDNILHLDKSDVRGVFNVKEDIAEYWNRHYGSGIITPENKLITG